MKKWLLNRWTLSVVGLLLLLLVVWLLGPYFAFGEARPLFSIIGRVIATLVLLFVWAAAMLWRTYREMRGSRKLAAEVAGQAEAPVVAQADPAAPADASQLKQRFEDAVSRLKKDRRGGGNLYRVPWYVIIGPPGSGKTTALVNSGLRFPMEQEIGKRAIKGVGGTRNCDWWFTEEAVLLDTAGRYTTQDSDRIADGAGWGQFLQLLKRHRRRRPINGVLVAYSASDLLTRTDPEFDADMMALRQRTAELNRHLGISLPVYLLVTKSDLIAGFREYFDDLDAEGRRQVWGATFALDDSRSGRAIRTLPAEFDALLERLNQGANKRLREERDLRRRAQLYAFPQQFAALRPRLLELVGDAFGSAAQDSKMFLRGVYFTSGTQDGTPIDRLLGSLGRGVGLAGDERALAGEKGRAYFIEQLLRDVVLLEAGIAGTNRRVELQKAALQTAAYVGIAVLTVGGLVALGVSYRKNLSYLRSVETAVDELEKVPAIAADPQDVARHLPRLGVLGGIVAAAGQDGKSAPWSMRAGLYQGSSVARAAMDAYSRELNATVVPALARSFAERIDSLTGEPDGLYEYLKGYLMLGEPKRLVAEQLAFLAAIEWERAYPDQPAVRTQLIEHLGTLLTDEQLQPVAIDAPLVTRARNALAAATPASLAYSRLRLSYGEPEHPPLRLDREVQGLETVFLRRSGRSFSEPVPAFFTKDAFLEISSKGGAQIAKSLQEDAWVFGDTGLFQGFDDKLTQDVIALYERDYIANWDAVLADLEIKPLGEAGSAAKSLGILGSGSSPLKVLLTIVSKNTDLTPPAGESLADGLAEKAIAKASSSALGKLLKGPVAAAVAPMPAFKPGAAITEHFADLHKLIDGPPGQAPIDRTLALLTQMSVQIGGMSDAVGGDAALAAIKAGGGGGTARAIEIETAQLPPAVAGILASLGGSSQALVRQQASGELAQMYRGEVVAECRAIVAGRYPFVKEAADDVPVADFARLFGGGGVFDSFFRSHLVELVDTNRSPWRWREAGGGSIGLPGSIPGQFEAADRIRQQFFRPGGAEPELRLTLTPEYLDANVQRLVIEAAGQRFEYSHGPQTRWPMKWPSDAAEQIAVTFDTGSGPGSSAVFEGPWAMFRMLDAASVQAKSEALFAVTLTAGGQTARLRLDAASIRNPFATPSLTRFRCGG